MTSSPDIPGSARHQVRLAGVAALAWVLFQLWALPAPLTRGAAGWDVAWLTVANVVPMLVVAVAVLRGSVLAAGALGAYGTYRLVVAVGALGMILDGRAARQELGPAIVWAAIIAAPFAVLWVRGGIAALHLFRGA